MTPPKEYLSTDIVQIKTQEELLNTGWEYKDGSYFYSGINDYDLLYPHIPSHLTEILGKIIKIKQSDFQYKIFDDCLGCDGIFIKTSDNLVYEITPEMISKYLKENEYPELVI
jgi:hypothetical protein